MQVELYMFGQKEHRTATVELADADDCAFCQFVHENIILRAGSVAFVCRSDSEEIRRVECQAVFFGLMPMLLCATVTADEVRSELMDVSAWRGGWRGKHEPHVVVRRRDGSFVDPWQTLRELCRSEGFTLVVDERAPDRPDILGQPQRDELCAQSCANNVIAVKPTLPPQNAFYAVSHEIAETRLDFTGHHQLLWREQCTVLARWCRRLSRGR